MTTGRPCSVRLQLAAGFLLVALASVLVTAMLTRGAADAQMTSAVRLAAGDGEQLVAAASPATSSVSGVDLFDASSGAGRADGASRPPVTDARPLVQRLNDRLERESLGAALLAAAIALAAAMGIGALIMRPLRGVNRLIRRLTAGDVEPSSARRRGGRETRELQAELAQLSASLRSRRDGRRAAVAQVSHESRNALGSILGRIEALQDGTLTDGPGTLRIVEHEARRLLRQVEDLHRLVDDDTDLVVRRTSVDLDGIVRASVLRHAGAARARRIDVRYASAGPVIVDSDGDRLAQVVDNLMSNGLRYTDAGGWIAVAVRREAGEARLEVTDSGIGMAEQELRDVFKPFWRAPGGHERAPDGLGVGLAVVREIVDALGGRVDVTSRVGTGSSFRVALPAASSRFSGVSRFADALRRPDAQHHPSDDASAWHRAKISGVR